jgi:two-component system, cell cycle response regulator DivK
VRDVRLHANAADKSSSPAAGFDRGASQAGQPVRTAEARGRKTVLIVEDNELNMRLFNDLLDAHGYRTLQARHASEAFSMARAHRPNLILMDIQLPETNGLEATKWLKDDDELCTIPVVAVTAFAMKGDEERMRAGGCEAYISKPISIARFLATVRRFIGDAPLAPQTAAG